MNGKLPASASVASPLEGVKLHAPSSARNADALCALLSKYAPSTGDALELASGTGQHIVSFAKTKPDLTWQPTDVDPTRLASIDAYRTDAELANVRPALHLNATSAGWHRDHAPKDLIILNNLLHLISAPQAERLITEAVATLSENGCFILYGPFKRNGQLISEGDAGFDADLRGADPAIGYKDDETVARWLTDAGASHLERVEMPANNLAFIARTS